jgi:hypothetical protein
MAKQLVNYVKLHSTTFVPSLGDVPATLPSNAKTLHDLEMSESPTGVLIQCRKVPNAPLIRFVIPYATVSLYTLGELVDDTVKLQAKKSA